MCLLLRDSTTSGLYHATWADGEVSRAERRLDPPRARHVLRHCIATPRRFRLPSLLAVSTLDIDGFESRL